MIHNNHSWGYLSSPEFIRNNEIYQNLKLRVINTINVYPQKTDQDNLYRYDIINPSMIYKKGYRNVRCPHTHMVEAIELNLGECLISSIYNYQNSIFPELRKIANIMDVDVIPLFGTDKFIPYFEVSNSYIFIVISEEYEMDDMCITYDEVEIEDDIIIPIQFMDLRKCYLPFYDLDKKIVPILEFILPTVEYDRWDYDDDLFGSIYKLCFTRIIKTILVYTPDCTLELCNLYYTNGYHYSEGIIEIPTICWSKNGYTVINLVNSVNFGTLNHVYLRVECNDQNKYKTITVCGVGDHIYRAMCGSLIEVYPK